MAHQYQFYVRPPVTGDEFCLEGEEARHAALVLRLRRGDMILAVDGEGGRYRGDVLEIDSERVRVRLLKRWADPPENRIHLTLAVAAPRGERSDWLIEKATEIGVEGFIPLLTRRSIARPQSRLFRWRRLAVAAMKQSGRAHCPQIHEPLVFAKALDRFSGSICYIAHEDAPHSMAGVLERVRRHDGEIVLFVGPEAGFDDDEISLAIQHNVQPLRLGRFRLRSETAALVGASLILNAGAGELT